MYCVNGNHKLSLLSSSDILYSLSLLLSLCFLFFEFLILSLLLSLSLLSSCLSSSLSLSLSSLLDFFLLLLLFFLLSIVFSKLLILIGFDSLALVLTLEAIESSDPISCLFILK